MISAQFTAFLSNVALNHDSAPLQKPTNWIPMPKIFVQKNFWSPHIGSYVLYILLLSATHRILSLVFENVVTGKVVNQPQI